MVVRRTNYIAPKRMKETPIKSLSDLALVFSYNARNRGGANSELFKEGYDESLHENTYQIRFCDLISVSLIILPHAAPYYFLRRSFISHF